MSFLDRYYKTTESNKSYVCVGLDPDINMLPEGLLYSDNPLWEFNKQIISATSDKIGAYKLNYAFYLANGKKGLEALEKSIDAVPEGTPFILDVKVGDIANTMVNYAKGYFDYLKADALTVNPLMGEDVIKPLLEYKDKFFFVLALTSNPSAKDFLKREMLFQEISKKINEWGKEQFGAVVGATNSQELKTVRSIMPETLFLIPGIGAQGGSLKDVMENAVGKNNPYILINSSRGIIHRSKGSDFAEAAMKETERLRNEINSYL